MEDAEKELLRGERRELCRLHAIRLSEIDKKIVRIDLALYGNGDPEGGILWMATQNFKALKWVAKLCTWILAIVGGSMLIKIYPSILHFISGKV